MVACCRSIMFKARYFLLTFKTCHSKIYPNADYQLVNSLLPFVAKENNLLPENIQIKTHLSTCV